MSEFHFRSISLEQMDPISPNFIYACILRRFRLGLFPGIFHKFVTECWPLIDIRISYLLNNLEDKRAEFPNSVYALVLTRYK